MKFSPPMSSPSFDKETADRTTGFSSYSSSYNSKRRRRRRRPSESDDDAKPQPPSSFVDSYDTTPQPSVSEISSANTNNSANSKQQQQPQQQQQQQPQPPQLEAQVADDNNGDEGFENARNINNNKNDAKTTKTKTKTTTTKTTAHHSRSRDELRGSSSSSDSDAFSTTSSEASSEYVWNRMANNDGKTNDNDDNGTGGRRRRRKRRVTQEEDRDHVGDAIARMLNEDRVPHFGYRSPMMMTRMTNTNANANANANIPRRDGFRMYPLLTARNCRAIRGLLSDAWNGTDRDGLSSSSSGELGRIAAARRRRRTTRSMRFLLESFAACFVAVYAANDIVLRLTSEIVLLAAHLLLSFVLFDSEEVGAVLTFLASAAPRFLHRWRESFGVATNEIFCVLEREFLWGRRFQGRTFLWSDGGRLHKFRRRHRRLMATKIELKQTKKERRRVDAERRRREKRSEPFTLLEIEKMERDGEAREKLKADERRMERRPPTLFPDEVVAVDDDEVDAEEEGGSQGFVARGSETARHLESLRHCRAMLSVVCRDERDAPPNAPAVFIDATRNSGVDSAVVSPKESIEVATAEDHHHHHRFPDIDINLERSRSEDDDGSEFSTTFSDGCSATGYDPRGSHGRGGHRNYSDDDDDDDADSGASRGSYASESTARSMPWVMVGAKIGHKLLTARKLRRVIANPDAAREFFPDEAKKLIESINGGGDFTASSSSQQQQQPETLPSSSRTHSWEGPSAEGGDLQTSPSLQKSKSNETQPRGFELQRPVPIRPPVHGMWTSPGSAATTSISYGARTLELTPSSPPNGGEHNNNGGGGVGAPSSRWPLQAPRSAPSHPPLLSPITSPIIQLEQRGDEGRYGSGTRTPTSLPSRLSINSMIRPPTSPPKSVEMILSTTNVTPQVSNASRHVFDFDQGTPPVPVTRLAPIAKGVKMVVPMFPPNCRTKNATVTSGPGFYQMGTVISSQRICIPPNQDKPGSRRRRKTNCLSVKVILDKALLRGSKFFEFHLRIMDEWNYIPRHSKFPIGSCVATTFGVGVLVGWRVEDDMHIIRSLWNRSGPGSGLAYLRRDSVHSVVEAAVGYDVQTTYGAGKVLAYVKGGQTNTKGKYVVRLRGRHRGSVMEFNRCQILSCQGATFVPVTEHIRAAALYRLEVIHYKAKLREQMLNGPQNGIRDKGTWRNFSEYVDLFANSFSKAIAEDPDFDQEADKFFSHIVSLLDKRHNDAKKEPVDPQPVKKDTNLCTSPMNCDSDTTNSAQPSLGWNINEMFGCFFVDPLGSSKDLGNNEDVLIQAQAFEEAHNSADILIRVLLRTITVARASVPDRPKLHMSLSAMQEALLFVRKVLQVQKKHTSRKLIEAWFRALNEISTTFGPLKQRATALGVQIAKKFRKHGNIAKRRILRFVDIVLGDTQLLHALELGNWKKSFYQLESAAVQARLTDPATCEQLRKGIITMHKNLAPRKKDRKSKAAAARNGKKMANFAKVVKVIATPGRYIVRLLTRDDVLAIFDRILVRVFEKDPHCSMVINIYAWNFESLRHLRTLNNMSIAGKLWETVLDAIDEELTFVTSEIPEQAKYFIEPFVKLFSLGVSQFHCIQSGRSNADWLEFLMQDEAVNIIQELDFKLIDSLEALCNDIKQVVQVLPYIKTIDNDILNLMDEFNLDLFLKEITDVMGDSQKSMAYITDRSAILVERFLDYLPRMSVPIERRELQDGWVLTCRSKDGGDLRLSDLSVLRENLHLSVLGSENVFQFSRGKDNFIGSPTKKNPCSFADQTDGEEVEETVLDEVRELIASAQSHDTWISGVGGLKEANHYKGVPPPLTGVPLSDKLKTQIDLWQTSAISDFELLETAIREVSYQIQLQKEREENGIEVQLPQKNSKSFNPSIDPTVLFLDIKNLTLRLEDFGFRVEKGKPLTIFDPVFEGSGSITVTNVSIALKVEVKKQRVFRSGLETPRPVLQLAKFDVGLEKLKLEFTETGADWILNAVLKGFSNKITEIVQENVKEQIVKQVHTLLEQVNNFVDNNPDLLMNALGINMADIEESIVNV